MGRSWNMKGACVVLGISCLFLFNVVAGERRSLQAETVYDITKYGAKGDGTTDDATAFIKAFREGCDSAGPAKIVVPGGNFMMGEVVLAGPCKAPPPLLIEIQGTLLANTDPSAYSNQMWILIEHVDTVKISGGGVLNGRGQNMWKMAGEDNHMPVGFTFQASQNGDISSLTFLDSMGFHSKLIDSTNIKVTNMTITAPEDSPNTDGIHLSNATNVEITDSTIATGDDCISIGTGSKNILVKNVKCGPGHGLAVGSLGKRPDEISVGNITFQSCSLKGTTNGCRIKSYHASPVMDCKTVNFIDITMDSVKNPIIIDQHYFSKAKPEQSNVKISDVHFKNIKGTTISEIPILLNCSTKVPCDTIELADVDLKPIGEAKQVSSVCQAATNVKATGTVNPPAPTC